MVNNFYREFEDRYRGSRELIKSRLEVYLPFIEKIKELNSNPKAIDLGCGRGEWLELLLESGCNPIGIDLDEGMLKACLERGYEVKKEDAIEALRNLEDNSMFIISAFHLVEHLPFEVLQTLVQEALRVLAPGGLLILETPNPENIRVGTEYFYMDPTHIKPIPSLLLSFLPEHYGFNRTKILRLQESNDLKESANITLLDVIQGASPDYSVIAQKSANVELLSMFDELFAKDYGLSLNLLIEKFESKILKDIEIETIKAKEDAKEAIEKSITAQKDAKEAIEKSIAAQKDAKDAIAKAIQMEHYTNHLAEKIVLIEQNFLSVLNSNSWKITKPLRLAKKLINWFTLGVYSWVTISEGSRPRRVLRKILSKLKSYVKSKPGLKNKIKFLLSKFPKLTQKLNNLAEQKSEFNLKIYGNKENFIDIYEELSTVSKDKSFEVRNNIFDFETISNNIEKIILEGHFNGSYSLASINRNLVNRILDEKNLNIKLSILPRESEIVDKIVNIPGNKEELDKFNNLINSNDNSSSNKTVQIFHHYPLVKDIDASKGLPIAIFFWEESKVPDDIIETLNSFYKGIVVTSWFVKKVLIDSGCLLPISIIAMPLIKKATLNKKDEKKFSQTEPINILHVSSCFPRKGADILLQGFNLACKTLDNLFLTIKTFHNPHNNILELVNLFVDKEFTNKINIILDDYNDEMMRELYSKSDIVVLPTRGEGLNMPAIESAEYCKPLVVTGFGAHTDFINNNAWLIPYQFSKSQTHFNLTSSVWVDASFNALADILIDLSNKLISGDEKSLNKIESFNSNINSLFFSSFATSSFLTAITKIKKYNETLKSSLVNTLSLITTWNIECGIAEYSKYIADELIDLNYKIDIFASLETQIKEQNRYKITKAFEQGSKLDLSKLSFNTKVIWIQHHFAFFPLDSDLEAQIKSLKSENRDFYITLHTTKPILHMPAQTQEEVRNCLNSMDRIFVHTIDDLNNLKRVGLINNVILVSQGISLYENIKVKKDEFTIACFGFLYPHKGASKLIDAFAKFVKLNPNQKTKLKLLMTVKNDYKTINEFENCKKLVDSLGIKDYVEWHTQFMEIEQIKEHLQQSDCVILPYQYTEESSSAASRMVLSICDCVAVTPAPIFDDIRDCCVTLSGFESEDIFDFIKKASIGLDEKLLNKLKDNRDSWINQNNWTSIAKQYDGILNSIAIDKEFLEN